MYKLFFALLFSGFWLGGKTQNPGEKYPVGQGPEDLVLDTFSGPARMIVSCTSRRESEAYVADFWAINPETGRAERIPRMGEPRGWYPRFHGIDLVKGDDGKLRLYAISHGVSREDKRNRILVYELTRTSLTLVDSVVNPKILKSPNDVCATADGAIYWTNDYGSGLGMAMRFIFKCKTSTIGKYKASKFAIVAKGLQYANGILPRGNKLYVSTTRGGKIYEYEMGQEGILSNRRLIAKKLKGLDNISFSGENIVVTGHPEFGKFIKNMKDEKNLSPSRVYSVSTVSGEVKTIFEDDGSKISACSVAQVWKGKLWMGQVFNGWIYSVNLP